MLKRLLLLLAAIIPLSAQSVLPLFPDTGRMQAGRVRTLFPSHAVTSSPAAAPEQRVFARTLAGGGWETTLVLLNMGSAPLSVRQYFWAPDGTSAKPTVRTGSDTAAVSALQSTLNPNSSVSLVLADTGSLQEGWSSLTYDASQGKLGGYAILRHRGLNGLTFETTLPLSTMQDFSLYLPFDNTAGYRMQLTLLNPVSNLTGQVLLSYLDPQGRLLLIDSVTLAPGQQMTFTLPDTYPDLANKTGTITIEANIDHLSVAGIRYNSSYGALAAVPAIN